MDNHAYTEYCFYLGSLSYTELLEEAEDLGVDTSECLTSELLRSAILEKVI